MQDNEKSLEEIYSSVSPDEIPWNREEPPKALVDFLNSDKISPCEALDLGCGLGHYSRYLATKGFDVIGIDISPSAIVMARKLSSDEGHGHHDDAGGECAFIIGDIAGSGSIPEDMKERFGFVLEWCVMHHVSPGHREDYVGNVYAMLAKGGKYLSVSFHEDDAVFPGTGKSRISRLGTRLYLSSESEIRELFEPFFIINRLKIIEIPGTTLPHQAILASMEKQ